MGSVPGTVAREAHGESMQCVRVISLKEVCPLGQGGVDAAAGWRCWWEGRNWLSWGSGEDHSWRNWEGLLGSDRIVEQTLLESVRIDSGLPV